MKVLKATGMIVGAMAVLMVAGLQYFLAIWIVLTALFMTSRLSKRVVFFSEWSWLQFLATIGCGVGVPYLILLLSVDF
jgi:hypothetical protein